MPTASVDSPFAWSIAAVAFAVGFIAFGVIYSFGVFLEPIMADLGSSRSATSALYAIASSAFYFLGPATGSLGDKFGPRAITGVGVLAMGGGLAATAFVTDISIAYLTYGLGVGIGAACAYIPTFAVVGGWFDRWRTRALSIAATGTGLGMLAIPPFCAAIIEHFGWRTATLALAAILVVSAVLVRPAPARSSLPTSGALGTTVRSRAFVQIYTSWVFGTIALFVPLVFLPAFAVARGADPLAASWLISIIGGASVLGRLGIAYAGAGRTLLLYKGSILAMAASYVVWLVGDPFRARGVVASAHKELLERTGELVAEGLQADYSKVMQYLPDEKRLLVRAGVGWPPGVVGRASVGADLDSPAGFALRTGKPVISNHLENEERLRTPELLVQHGVRRAMNVILQGDGTPFGVLEVDSRSEGEFVQHDLAFLQGAANILGMAIERQRHERSLKLALERQRLLLSELNHRVKNSLSIVSSMLSLQANTSDDENLKLHLQEASSRVATVARAHERLYQTTDIEKLDVGAYIKDVCGDLPVTDGTTVCVEAAVGINLSMDRAISIALIVVELATNAMKHAYRGERSIVWVVLTKKGDTLVLSVTDEGCGLPAGFAPEKSKGLGMRIVIALAEQLNAELRVKRRDKGTSFELRVPLNLAP